MEFKEWLKKNKGMKNHFLLGVISVYAFGDFAWKKYLLNCKERPDFKENQLNHWYYTGKAEVWEEIATNCLGKKEIQHRLKEAKKE